MEGLLSMGLPRLVYLDIFVRIPLPPSLLLGDFLSDEMRALLRQLVLGTAPHCNSLRCNVNQHHILWHSAIQRGDL